MDYCVLSISDFEFLKKKVNEVFNTVQEGDIHGWDHACRVWKHIIFALKFCPDHFFEYDHLSIPIIKESLELAGLLHDIDDEKIFKKHNIHDNVLYPNAISLLEEMKKPKEQINLIIQLIDLVSFSKNGIREVPYRWMAIPRDADRLEALGSIGVIRCLCYGCHVDRPIYNQNTPRLTSENAIWIEAIRQYSSRLVNSSYSTKNKENLSTLEYFLVALIPRSVMASDLPYFLEEATIRINPIIHIIQTFGIQGYITEDYLDYLAQQDPSAWNIFQEFRPLVKPFLFKLSLKIIKNK